MATMNLTARQLVLIRCGLLARCDLLRDRPDMRDSYRDSVNLLHDTFPALLQAQREEATSTPIDER
jgi:hypothetical protein